jgi:hypothetical protein
MVSVCEASTHESLNSSKGTKSLTGRDSDLVVGPLDGDPLDSPLICLFDRAQRSETIFASA